MKAEEIVVGVSVGGDYDDEVPIKAKISLDRELLTQLLVFADAVKSLGGLWLVVDAGTPPVFYRDDAMNEEADDIELVYLHVDAEGSFWWTGNIKHTSVEVSTDAIQINEQFKLVA